MASGGLPPEFAIPHTSFAAAIGPLPAIDATNRLRNHELCAIDGPTAHEIMEDVMLAALARGGALGVLALLWPSMCFAWGNEGHKTVALTAAKILSTEAPATLAKVNAILAKDKPDIWPGANVPVATDIGNEATWADLLREGSDSGRKVTES